MAKKVTFKNLKSNIGKYVRTSSGSLLKLFITKKGTPTIVWLEMKKEEIGWPVTLSDNIIGAEKFINNKAYYIHGTENFKDIFGDKPAYYVDEEPKTKKTFANTLSIEEIVERLQNGEELKIQDRTLKMIKGVLCCKRPDSMQINAGLSIDCENDYYFEEEVKEEPFKITEVGLYKTRDGRKVFISFIQDTCAYNCIGLVEGSNNTAHWKDNGKFFTRGPCEMEIVSKWEE